MFCIGTLKEATKKLIKETQQFANHGHSETSKQSNETLRQNQTRDDEFHGKTRIKLKKLPGDDDFGIVTTGGTGRQSSLLKVAYIKPGTPAFRHDGIEVGDYISALEGKTISSVQDLSASLHNKSTQQISLELDYTLPDTSYTSFSVVKKRVEVKIARDEHGSLGLTLRGGSSTDANHWRPITVTQIRPGGPVDREGSIKIGDRILAINDVSMRQVSLDHALRYLKVPDNGDVTFLVEYDVSVLEVVQNAAGPLLVEIDKVPGCSLGVTLDQCLFKGHRVMFITEVVQASIADRCGALHQGDHILAIDGCGLEEASLEEANEMLRVNPGHQIQLEIVPAKLVAQHTTYTNTNTNTNANANANTNNSNINQALQSRRLQHQQPPQQSQQQIIPLQTQQLQPQQLQRSLTLPQVSSSNFLSNQHQKQLQTLQRQQRLATNSAPRKDASLESDESQANESSENSKSTNHDEGRFSSASMTSLISNNTYNSMTTQVGSAMLPPCQLTHNWGSLRSRSNLTPSTSGMFRGTPQTQICHVDVLEVVLVAEKRNFGFQIESASGRSLNTFDDHNVTLREAPVISFIEPRGPAERCGVLQEGDRVLAINGQNLEGRTKNEVHDMIRESGVKIILLVEFDVAESIIPSSGVFIVKLAKRSAGLGVTISCPQVRKPGQHLVISDVKKGSVAHRTGSIQPGDKLLAIDNVRLDDLQCSLEDSARILQDTHDIVKLTIQKDEGFADEPDPSHLITYTVELPKFAGPVGIMVSGSEEPFGPIFISSLLPGGMAERTGALHVGDRLLAINGTSLRGKTPTDAVHLLQNAGSSVTLKITRPANKRVPETKLETGHGSVDSALESWGSTAGADGYLATGAKVFCHPSLRHRPRSQHYFDSVNEQCDDVSNDTTSPISPKTTPTQKLQHQSSIENPSSSIAVTTSSSDTGIDMGTGLPSSLTSNAPLPLSSSTAENIMRWRDREFAKEDVGLVTNSGNLSIGPHVTEIQDCGKNDADEWSKRLDELDQLRLNTSPAMDSFSDLPDIVEVIGDDEGDQALDQGIKNRTEEESNPVPLQLPTITECSDAAYMANAEGGGGGGIQLKEVEEQLQNIFTPTPIELLKVMLTKAKEKDDFGFSLSDGVFEKGVYVSAIRPAGPASSKLRPYDRILQVNSTKVRDLDCSQLVPLIASSGSTLELVITRNPLVNLPKSCQHFKKVEQVEKGGSLKSFKEHRGRQKRLSTDFRSSTNSPRSASSFEPMSDYNTLEGGQKPILVSKDTSCDGFKNSTIQQTPQLQTQISLAKETYIGEDVSSPSIDEDEYENPFPSSKNGTVRRKPKPLTTPTNKNNENNFIKTDTGKS